MIGLIPFIKNDYWLSVIYLLIIVIALTIYREPKDYKVFIFGLIILTLAEAFFVSTGVETFERKSLLNLMPIWLPILWGYALIAIKRVVIIL